jgi:hypothetical protein
MSCVIRGAASCMPEPDKTGFALSGPASSCHPSHDRGSVPDVFTTTRPRRRLRFHPIMVGLAFAGAGVAGASGDTGAVTLPKDPCALLKPAEIGAALDPNTTVGSGVATTSTAPLAVSCSYTWGPRTREWGETVLTVTVIDAKHAWPGLSADMIQQGLLAKVRSGGNDSPVAGVGDAAVFTFESRASNATAEAYSQAKGVDLAVELHSGRSLQSKDQLVALLKQALAGL